MATIQKRGETYRITVSAGYDSQGKQVRHTMTWKPAPGMSQRQIEKELERQKVMFEERCQGGSGACTMKFEAFARRWFQEDAETRMRPRTLAMLHGLEERTYKALGHLRIDKITPLHIQAFIRQLQQPGTNQKTGGGLSPKTQQHYLTFISSVFEYARQMDLLRDNPARRVKVHRGEAPEKRIYTLEQAQLFLDRMQEEPLSFQAFCALAIYGGFRRSELLGLEWKDMDFDSSIVTVCRTSQYTKERGIYTDTTKTKGSQRSLKLPESVFAILRRYRTEQAERRLKLGDRWEDHDRLFTTWDGKPMSPSAPSKQVQRFCERVGLPYLGIHTFRHLNASLLISSGADVRTVSASLGHSQTSTTLNIYAHTFAAAQAKAADAVADALPLHHKQA